MTATHSTQAMHSVAKAICQPNPYQDSTHAQTGAGELIRLISNKANFTSLYDDWRTACRVAEILADCGFDDVVFVGGEH